MSSSSLSSPTAENAQKLKEAQLRIGMALKNAQYALTTHAHRGLATALHENVNALTALSMYLTLSGSSVKAAAIAGQMAKILKSVGMYIAAKERSGGASQHAEGSRHSSAPNTPASSSVVLDESRFLTDASRESAGVVQDLHRAMEELTRQRDALAEEKHALEVALEESRQRLAATKSLTAVETHSSDATDRDDDASIRRLRAEVDSLKHEVREEHMRAAALRDQLHEAEEQIEEQQDHVQALKSQLRLSQEEKLSQDAAFAKKEEEIKALQETLLQSSPSTTAPSSRVTSAAVAPPAAPPPRGYVDKDDFDALKLQNQLLQEALRNQPAHARPIDSHTVLSQQTLEEIEADHQQQLEAMKLTIQEQYNRETELLEKQRTMQESVDDLKRQLQLSNNRQWVQQERERHLNEMDAAKMRIKQLQETIHKQDEEIQTQQAQLQHCAENDRKHADVIKSLKLQHETQLATLNEELRARNDELNETLEAKYDLSTQLEAHRIQTAAAIAAKEEQCNCSQREISGLTLALTALREQHEARVAELQQQLEVERDHAAASQSTVEERECALQQRLAELRTSMTALREQHEARVAELQQEHAAQAAQQQQQLEVEREQHEARVAELQQQLEVERDHAAASQSTVEERECALQQRLAELRTSMTALREQHEARVAELQQEHAAQAAQQQQQLEVEREQHEARVAELQQEHAAQAAQQQQQLEVEREQHEARVAELQQELEVERDHAAASQSTVEERECALQQRLAELRTSMTALCEQHEARVAELQQEHAAQAAQQQQQLEVEREQHEARVAELQQEHAAQAAQQQQQLEVEREQHEARVAEQQQQLEVEREQHEARVAELQQQLEVERDHAAASQSTVEERECALQQRLAELRTSMTALCEQHEARVAELQQEHAAQAAQQQQQLEVEREQHEARVAEQQQQLEVERDHAAASQSTVEERECALQQRLAELRTSMTALREQHEARVAELQQEHAAQAAQQQQQLEVEREQHEARVAELQQEHAAQAAQLQQQLEVEREQHEARVAEQQQQLEVERDHAAASQSTVEERECALQQRLAELRTSMTALREQHEARVAELQQEHAAQAAQQQQQLEVEREQHEARVAEQQQQLEVERDHAAASQSTVEERECALQQRLAELRTSMTALCEQHEARVAELQQEHAAQAAQQQQQLEVEREQHEARVAELQQEHAAQAAQLQQQLEVEREEGKRESVRWKAEGSVTQGRVDELEEERKAAKARVEELKAQLLREQERTEQGERKVDERRKKVEEDSKTVTAAHAAVVQKLKDEHAAALKRAEDGCALDVKHVRREFAEKLAVTSQPVEWLKEENEALKVREKELEEKLKEVTSGKMAALARAQEAEQVLTSRKGEVRRLKDECASMQSTMATCLEERDAALKKLKDDAQLTEEAQANLVRLEALRKELKEVQVRLDTAEKDKALLLSRYKRTSTEKDECAEAARKLLTQYKEMAAARERLVSQLAAAEALAAEKSMRVEELTRATIVNAGVTSKGSQDDALEASTQNTLEDTVCEKQERIKALVAELNEVARENKMLKLELDAAKDRRVAPQQPLLAAEPASTQSAFAQDLGSLAGMRDILSTMHRQLNPILEQLCAHERARAVAEASPSTSSSAVEALEALTAAMESAHTTMQSTLEDFAAAARRLRVSAQLQGVVYGKLLATSAPMPALVDVSLIRACTALLGEMSFGSALGKEEKASHGVLPLVGNGVQHYCSGSITSVVQDSAAAARKAEGAVAITGSDQQSPSMWSHYHADARAPSALASPANLGNPASSAYIVSPACRRADHRERAMLGDFGPGRKASRLGPPLRPSFENFAAAQLAISAAEERAGLRTAPTPPWK
ncbi:hypothetical protein LSCM4_02907 [Leishmania orientalis]|uniref:Uncharacterized protein n=1 Tax=Leishmania orientalis TaxID=2249476 RepID=A0A836KLL0_9TRYP|nr:hypothetical protein LSCM4_02907 [Leishmania orientalis]